MPKRVCLLLFIDLNGINLLSLKIYVKQGRGDGYNDGPSSRQKKKRRLNGINDEPKREREKERRQRGRIKYQSPSNEDKV